MKYLNPPKEIREDANRKLKDFFDFNRGRTSFTYTMPSFEVEGVSKAEITFSIKAHSKIIGLVSNFDSEVAWHATVRRDSGIAKYYVEDVFVHKHVVTGATLRSDLEEQEAFYDDFEEEAGQSFSKLRLQGHSHVEMQSKPSPTDIEQQESIAETVLWGDFYIFMITNKRGVNWFRIFDSKYNIIFENNEIICNIETPDCGYDQETFIRKAKELVKPAITKPEYTYYKQNTEYRDEYRNNPYKTKNDTKPVNKNNLTSEKLPTANKTNDKQAPYGEKSKKKKNRWRRI